MAIIDLFSKRQKRMRGEVPDIYVYDEMPGPLRVQVKFIIEDTINKALHTREAGKILDVFHKMLCREYGLPELNRYHSVLDFSSFTCV